MSIREKCVNQAKEAASKVDFEQGIVRCSGGYVNSWRFTKEQVIYLIEHDWQLTLEDVFYLQEDGLYYRKCPYWAEELWDTKLTRVLTVYDGFVVDPGGLVGSEINLEGPKLTPYYEYTIINGELCRPLERETHSVIIGSRYPIEVLKEPESLKFGDYFKLIGGYSVYRKDIPYFGIYANKMVRKEVKFCGAIIPVEELRKALFKELFMNEIIDETNIMQLWQELLDDNTMTPEEWKARRDILFPIKEMYFPVEQEYEQELEQEPEKQLTTEEILLAKIKELEDKIAVMSKGAHKASEEAMAHKASEAHSQPEATPQSGEVLEAPSGDQFVITPPPMLVQIIKTTCKITGNKVYYGGEVIGVYRQIDPDTRVKYPVEYIRAVLLDEKPDISFLFYVKDGRLFRANHPFWSATQKDTEVTKSNVCGVVITWEAKPMLPGGPELSSDVIDKIGLVEDKLAYKGVVDIAYNIGGRVYTAAYLSHLVFGTQNKKPLALFYKLNDHIVRSEHKCWGAYRLQRVADSVSINGTRLHVGELKKAVSISEKRYIKLLADNVFTLVDGQLLYAGKPFTKSRKFCELTVTPEIILAVKDS